MSTSTTATNDPSQYIPGVCNIGKDETKQRRKAAIILFVILVLSIALLVALCPNHIWRLLVFFPAAGFAISFQQLYFHFCVAYGMKGLYNFGNMGTTFTVSEEENLKKDRAKVRQMVIIGILFGLLLAVAFYFLPF